MGTVDVKDVAKLMPLTARWVKGRREAYGHPHVNEQIRRGIAGERNRFYACEAGHHVGTAFDLSEKGHFLMNMPFVTGASFVAFIREPEDVAHVMVGAPGLRASDGAH